jgi:hypothetical protein
LCYIYRYTVINRYYIASPRLFTSKMSSLTGENIFRVEKLREEGRLELIDILENVSVMTPISL